MTSSHDTTVMTTSVMDKDITMSVENVCHAKKHENEEIRGYRSGRKGSLEPGPLDRTLPDSTVTQRTDRDV